MAAASLQQEEGEGPRRGRRKRERVCAARQEAILTSVAGRKSKELYNIIFRRLSFHITIILLL